MHAVVVRTTINDVEAALQELRDRTVPSVSQAPGFVTGYWTRKDDTGMSMVVFESEDAAREVAERVQALAPEAVTVHEVEVREVTAHA